MAVKMNQKASSGRSLLFLKHKYGDALGFVKRKALGTQLSMKLNLQQNCFFKSDVFIKDQSALHLCFKKENEMFGTQ